MASASPTHRLICAKTEIFIPWTKRNWGKLHGVLLFGCLLNEDIHIQRPFWILHYCLYGYNGFHKVH